MKVFLVLPAFNEERNLSRLFRSCEEQPWRRRYDLSIILVDDGSSDGTAQIGREWGNRLNVEVMIHPENRGLGETIRDGLFRAAELGGPDDVIVAMDADNSHPVELIADMVQLVERGKDVVIASRFRPGAKVVGLNPFRRFLTVCARILYQSVLPITGVRDYTCGYRAYRASLLKRASQQFGADLVTERGFTAMAEILAKLASMGATMAEVPMVLRYDRKLGPSKMRVGSTMRTSLKLLWRHRISLRH